jgi:hypothetical protein
MGGDGALSQLLRYSFAGPGHQVLPDVAVHGLADRIKSEWVRYAACQCCDGDAWFPDERTKPNPLVGKVCADCPVARACLAFAVLHDEEGIWAGTRRGQRLHARARLFNQHPVADVLADLLASPVPDTEYHIPDPHQVDQADHADQPEQPGQAEQLVLPHTLTDPVEDKQREAAGWREAS